MLKLFRKLVKALAFIFVAPSMAAAHPQPTAQVTPSAEATESQELDRSYLFVVTAENARIEQGRLIMSGVASDVRFFTDRPYRETGGLPLASLLDHWNLGKDSFADDPPNAVLISHSREREPVILEIMNPLRDGNTLTFEIVPLDRRSAGKAFGTEGPATLVIDTCIGLSCW